VESGLVLHDVDKNSFTIPSPVLELLVPQLSGRRSRRFIRLATRALDAVLPSSDPTNWSVLEEFVAAADHCISNVASSQDTSRELIIILVDLLEYFEVRGQHARTRELCRRAISISEYELPDQQELSFYLLMAIASALSHLKSYDEAEHQIQRARSLVQESNDRENVIGRAPCVIMLASVRRDRGRFQEAASLFEEVIRAFGPYENEDSEFVAEVLEEYAGFLTSLGERARESEVRLKASAIRARHSS